MRNDAMSMLGIGTRLRREKAAEDLTANDRRPYDLTALGRHMALGSGRASKWLNRWEKRDVTASWSGQGLGFGAEVRRRTSMTARCSGEARSRACTTSQLHLLSSMSVPILPITSGSPKASR